MPTGFVNITPMDRAGIAGLAACEASRVRAGRKTWNWEDAAAGNEAFNAVWLREANSEAIPDGVGE